MLSTLLESRFRPRRNRMATSVSALVHGVLIIAAGYATASGSQLDHPAEPPTKIHWIPNTRTADQSPARPEAARPKPSALRRAFETPSVRIDVDAPSVTIDIDGSPIPITDFTSGPTFGSDSLINRSGNRSDQRNGRPFDAADVDVPAAAIANSVRPDYPASLRNAGIEGEVVAQFVVDQSGRAQASSARILSATNDLFAESVRRALPKMRFIPARVSGRAVPQMVQQLFVFRLDR